MTLGEVEINVTCDKCHSIEVFTFDVLDVKWPTRKAAEAMIANSEYIDLIGKDHVCYKCQHGEDHPDTYRPPPEWRQSPWS